MAMRSDAKGGETARALVARTGRDVFEPLTVDLGEVESVEAAVADPAERGHVADFLLLNAGFMTTIPPTRNSVGIDLGYAVGVIGHHVLTMGLLDRGLLGDSGHVVIAGSAAVRGNVPGMPVPGLERVSARDFNGGVPAALEALTRLDEWVTVKPDSSDALAKSLAAWWAASLSERLTERMTGMAVSPGAAPATSFIRDPGFVMRWIMMPMIARWSGRWVSWVRCAPPRVAT